ncbi:MAG: thiamine phosphate synthase, partial [Chloroflexota bacterium]|nr:thiamine phosphate synthase [Chloroflexota bacterium]
GAIFATATKADANKPIELAGLLKIARACTIPMVGIGGINVANAASVIRAGAAGVAVVSAIVNAEDVQTAAQEFQRVIHEARKDS